NERGFLIRKSAARDRICIQSANPTAAGLVDSSAADRGAAGGGFCFGDGAKPNAWTSFNPQCDGAALCLLGSDRRVRTAAAPGRGRIQGIESRITFEL